MKKLIFIFFFPALCSAQTDSFGVLQGIESKFRTLQQAKEFWPKAKPALVKAVNLQVTNQKPSSDDVKKFGIITTTLHLYTFAFAVDSKENIEFLKPLWIQHAEHIKKFKINKFFLQPKEISLNTNLAKTEKKKVFLDRWSAYINSIPMELYKYFTPVFLISDCLAYRSHGDYQESINCFKNKISGTKQAHLDSTSLNFIFTELGNLYLTTNNSSEILSLFAKKPRQEFGFDILNQYFFASIEIERNNLANAAKRVIYLQKQVATKEGRYFQPFVLLLETKISEKQSGAQKALQVINQKVDTVMAPPLIKLDLYLQILNLSANNPSSEAVKATLKKISTLLQNIELQSIKHAAYYCLGARLSSKVIDPLCVKYAEVLNTETDSSFQTHPLHKVYVHIIQSTGTESKSIEGSWPEEAKKLYTAAKMDSGFIANGISLLQKQIK